MNCPTSPAVSPSASASASSGASALSRRNFLGLAAAAAPVALLGSSLTAHAADAATATKKDAPTPTYPATFVDPAADNVKKKIPIGLELYSVRNELMRNLPDTLRKVAKMGFECVEFYSPYFTWTFPFAKGVRSLIDDLGLRCHSTHNGFASLSGDTMAKAIELNQILGAKHIVLASPPREANGLEGWKKVCGQLTTAVEQLKPHGLSAGYHNHQAEWKTLEGGQRIMDVIAQNTPPEFVLQLDVGTALEMGVDTLAWVKANPGRIKSVHLKDWKPGDKADEKAYRVLFGEGVAPWKELITAVEHGGGVEYYLLEQEGSRYPEFETVERCLKNWKEFRRTV